MSSPSRITLTALLLTAACNQPEPLSKDAAVRPNPPSASSRPSPPSTTSAPRCWHEDNLQYFPSFGISFSIEDAPRHDFDVRDPVYSGSLRGVDGGYFMVLGGAGGARPVVQAQSDMMVREGVVQDMWYSEWASSASGDAAISTKEGRHSTSAYRNEGFNAAVAIETAYGTSVSFVFFQHDAESGGAVRRAVDELVATLCVTPPVLDDELADAMVGAWRPLDGDGFELSDLGSLELFGDRKCTWFDTPCTYQAVGHAVLFLFEEGSSMVAYPEFFGTTRVALNLFSYLDGHPVEIHFVR